MTVAELEQSLLLVRDKLGFVISQTSLIGPVMDADELVAALMQRIQKEGVTG